MTTPEWIALADDFYKRQNAPHDIGTLDEKHVVIKKPHSSGIIYHNYKGFFSVVIMALVDTDYKFIWVGVGGFGYMSDSKTFNTSELRECIVNDWIRIPKADKLPFDDKDTPYFIIAC